MQEKLPASIKNKIDTLKKKHSTIYGMEIGEDYFILKPLSRKEFSVLVKLQDYMVEVAEDFIFKTCVLHPKLSAEDTDNMLAGTISEVTRIVIDISGFSSAEALTELVQENRDVMDLADNQITAMLCKAFPQLTPEIIDEFDIYKITHYLALAEQILGVTLDISTEQKSQKTKPDGGPIDFQADNKELFKSEVGNIMPKGDHNINKLREGNVG